MMIQDWQFGPSWTLFYWRRTRNFVATDGTWWPEWYVFIGPIQLRVWGRPRQ